MTKLGRALMVIVAIVGGCSSTTILSSWKDPTVGPVVMHKVLVVAPAHDPSLRRTAEDEMVAQIKHAQAIPSYTLISDADLGNNETVRARARAAGIDGIVVMRLVTVQHEATWVPGATMGPYYAYGGWPVYDPGYVQVDTHVRLETNVYSVPDDKLIWASGTNTVNPSSVRSLIESSVKAIAKEMREQRFLP